MHDLTNTLDCQFGFHVKFVDGSQTSEFIHTWDEVPRKPIARLGLVAAKTRQLVLEFTGFQEYFFVNEAVSSQQLRIATGEQSLYTDTDKPVVIAKIFGCIKKGEGVTEVRVQFPPEGPRGAKTTYKEEEFRYSKSILRPGV